MVPCICTYIESCIDIHMVCIIVTVHAFLEVIYGNGSKPSGTTHLGDEPSYASELVGLYPNPYVNSPYMHTSKYSVFDYLFGRLFTFVYLHVYFHMLVYEFTYYG